MSDVLDFSGDYGSDTRPARAGVGSRKPWAKDPSGPNGSDGTRLDATFANDVVALIRATLVAFGITSNAGDDAALADAIRAAVSAPVGEAGGIAPLDGDGLVPVERLPAVAITDTFSASSDAAMILLDAQKGDVCIRDDLNRSYILAAAPASTLANWKLLKSPTDAVLSVAGLVGAITATALKAALGITESDVSGLSADLAAINSALGGKAPLASPSFSGNPTAPTQTGGDNSTKLANTAFVAAAIAAISSGVASFNTRTGAVSLTSSDVLSALGYTPATTSRSISTSGLATGGGTLGADQTITVTAALKADYLGKTNTSKALTAGSVWGAMTEVALTDGASISGFDLSTGVDFTLAIAGAARTFPNPTNIVPGQKGRVRIQQDSTGGRTITAWGSVYKWVGGNAGVLSTAANAVDYLDYDARSSSEVRLSLSKGWA
ncbi:hypothetical protein Hden_1239 [Hyphomicrobium denitrificans ATCC 51888]|uniref:Uncharacterized protein n=1 Tax=Hyphomicrobium denitrificans (strain ATCC 51888 / DSM 1869 / NCIMB 11706 / TK 0415) TaxID=582899 RepID=D8JWD8_HYPDA|nr:hypothetical protein [Hyphomicrobium denitrificans]ADJ23051.1 hypothetical protein Hden_1239 [Hyphomicrobium denitrificans ATCC 51888]